MASDPEGMNYFTEWVPARDTGREIPYLWIWKGFTDQCFKICVIIKPKFLGVQNTLRGEDSMLQSIWKRERVWKAVPAFTATHPQTLLRWDASSLCSFALSHLD